MEKTKSQNKYNPKLSLKPHTHNTMLMTFFKKSTGTETIICNLADISIEHIKEEVIIEIDLPRYIFGKSKTGYNWVLCVSDDPTMNHAADWTQLGYSRFRYSGDKIKMLGHGRKKKMRFSTRNFEFNLLQPERRFPHDSETKFRLW